MGPPSKPWLFNLRHRPHDLAFRNRDRTPLDDKVLETDEAYQDAGEKRRLLADLHPASDRR